MKRKRAPGGGRKPKGAFSGLTSPLSIRMPPEMRKELESAAKKKGWSLTQELLWRLRVSLSKEQETRRDPATRAVCHLISEMGDKIHKRIPLEWRRNPFLFRAFKIGVANLLDELEPPGEIQSPIDRNTLTESTYWLTELYRTPETIANDAARETLTSLYYAREMSEQDKQLLRSVNIPGAPGYGEQVVGMLESEFYSMSAVRRDLGIDVDNPPSLPQFEMKALRERQLALRKPKEPQSMRGHVRRRRDLELKPKTTKPGDKGND
jgi:Arc-like DNA binding domain